TCLAIYSRCINTELPIEDVLGALFPWCLSWSVELKELFASYVEAKQRQNVLDYDDLLLYWAQMMSVPALAEEIGVLFDHILVDEYQDTNRLQATILLGLKPSGRGLTVVGDDAQSIYSFRAATVRNILDFPGLFSPSATIVTLDQNYRSTQPLLAAANAVIALSASASPKACGPTAPAVSYRGSSAWGTRGIRLATSSNECLRTARPARGWRINPSCFAHRIDRHVYASRTRFIPDDLLFLFEKAAWPVAAMEPGGVRARTQGMRIDLHTRLRDTWR